MTPLIGLHLGVWNKLEQAFWFEKSGFQHQRWCWSTSALTLEWLAKEFFIFLMLQLLYFAWTLCPARHEIWLDKIEFWSDIARWVTLICSSVHMYIILDTGMQSSIIYVSNKPDHLKLLVSLFLFCSTAQSSSEAPAVLFATAVHTYR